MNFHEYMWSLASGIFKKTKSQVSDVSRLLHSYGEILEDAKGNIFLLRRQAIIGSASGKALDIHGGKRFPRYSNESDDQYRDRLINRISTAKLAGTNQGIILAIKSLGYEVFELNPLYLTDPSRWAEFDVIIDEDFIDIRPMDILRKTIIEIKQASSLPNIGFLVKLSNIETLENLSVINRTFLDLGSGSLNQFSLTNTSCIYTGEGIGSEKITIENSLWYLDGKFKLDGTMPLAASINKEDL